ncbi:hypothetical protein DICSQDRAFT_89330 [Dichomitus squalens LYAD-421 SS1]|uniref:Fungal-type protein kinase domain-containing protein n=1 Tax=Dichomitus squalens (strain LYAD-421) TaxID=732165 RepID=R7STA6_DICSQ|nr:uncharacterized protein DICSQDRAFT_89330 [Dichomitus squalens LYAD-421 SS1]EJF59464.1 hypothetical protein DICSQDRAFT_89330 [Dichomitus squalens LYAD-421 SS1]
MLKSADALSQHDLPELFIQAMNRHCFSSSSTLSTYTCDFDTESTGPITHAAIFRAEESSSKRPQSWFDQSVPVVFVRHFTGGDPFDRTQLDDEYGVMKEESQRVFKHLTKTVDRLFAAQQRVFLYMLLVMGRRCRVLRWDRAGVTVTPASDYYERPRLLRDYLWRLSNMESSALGFDPSATRVLPGDVDFVRMDFSALPDPTDADHTERDLTDEVQEPSTFAYVRAMFRASLASDWPRYRLQVPDGKETRSFLVGKPVFRADGVLGRGTRGYVALDCETHRFVWLKDTWRAAYMIAQREGDVLQKLNQAGVEYIPTLVCHGDILDQSTKTFDWWERIHALPSIPSSSSLSTDVSHSSSRTLVDQQPVGKRKRAEDIGDDTSLRRSKGPLTPDVSGHSGCPLQEHKHYRIVVEEVAIPLKKFRNGKQLASVVLDAIQAHFQASTKPPTPVLHRDISSGNILIYPRVRRLEDGTRLAMVWTGLLVDWELSKPIHGEKASSKATQAERMGTYQFMSVNLLTRPWSLVKISDELESFFHVLVYNSVLYLRSNCDCRTSYIDNYFNDYAGPARAHTCGWKSFAVEIDDWLCTQVPDRSRLLFDSPMDDVFGEIHKCLKAHYKSLSYDLVQAAPPRPKVVRPPLSADLKLRAPVDISCLSIPEDIVKKLKNRRVKHFPPPDPTPTQEDRERARRIMEHQFMIEHIARILRSSQWPEDDRVAPAEECAPSSDDARAGVLAPSTTLRSNKRRRIAGPERHVSFPARLHASTRRTRVAAYTVPVFVRV